MGKIINSLRGKTLYFDTALIRYNLHGAGTLIKWLAVSSSTGLGTPFSSFSTPSTPEGSLCNRHFTASSSRCAARPCTAHAEEQKYTSYVRRHRDSCRTEPWPALPLALPVLALLVLLLSSVRPRPQCEHSRGCVVCGSKCSGTALLLPPVLFCALPFFPSPPLPPLLPPLLLVAALLCHTVSV